LFLLFLLGPAFAARDFNGSTDYVDLTANFGEGATTGAPFTWAMWFQPDTVTGNQQILGRYNGTQLMQIGLGNSNVGASYGVSPFDGTGGGTAASIGTWMHVALTFSTTGVGIAYVNGSATPDDENPTGSFAAATAYNIGRRGGDGLEDFDGKVAEVAYWNRALSAAEIASLAKGLSPNCVWGGLKFYSHLIRDIRDDAGALPLSTTGTTVFAHPRIIYCG
jgi:hypothetical protein